MVELRPNTAAAFTVAAMIASAGDSLICEHASDITVAMLIGRATRSSESASQRNGATRINEIPCRRERTTLLELDHRQQSRNQVACRKSGDLFVTG